MFSLSLSSPSGRKRSSRVEDRRNHSALKPRTEILEGRALLANLIVNGDFEAGNTGFSTQYFRGSLLAPQTYDILRNPRDGHPSAASFGDHTSGSGLMMAVNGAERANVLVWSQTVSVVPNTDYSFSSWVASWTSGPGDLSILANLDFSINGSSLGASLAPDPVGVWQRFTAGWNSGANTSATIRIIDLHIGHGNDFALDDITLTGSDTDLVATSLDWNTAQGGVNFGYEVAGAALTEDTTAALYWASGTTLDDVIGGPVYETTIERPVGQYGPFYVPKSVPGTPPAGASHLILAVDPDDAIAESDEPNLTNNVQSLALPDLIGASFGYQVLEDDTGELNGPLPFNAHFVVGASVTNAGLGDASPFRVAFYASPDATIGPGDDLLGTAVVSGLAAGAEQVVTLPGSVQLRQDRSWTGKIHLGIIIDPDDELAEVEASRENNANRAQPGDRVDRAIVQLYDPVSAVSELASGFRTERAAALFLFRSGFSPVLPGTGSGWSRHLSPYRLIRSRFDGVRRPGLAYRQNAFIRPPDATHSTYWILLQGTTARAEPSPEAAPLFEVFSSGWFRYVRDWHRRFS
jgi:CARDB